MEIGYINMKKKSNWETSNSPYKEQAEHSKRHRYEERKTEPVEATREPDQALDNDMMMELMSMCEEMNVWQRFPIITAHFLQEFDQGEMSEAEMAKEIYLLALEAERDEEISEEDLIRTPYRPPAEGESSQRATMDTAKATQCQIVHSKEEVLTAQGTSPPNGEREESKNQRMTKDKILESVEDGTWSAEQGREEYKRLEEWDKSNSTDTPVVPNIIRTPIEENKTNSRQAAPIWKTSLVTTRLGRRYSLRIMWFYGKSAWHQCPRTVHHTK